MAAPKPFAPVDCKPPTDLDAERQTLGSIILDHRRIDEVAEVVKTTDFYDERHEAVYSAVLSMHAERRNIDGCTLSSCLKRRGSWVLVGSAYLAEILHSVPVAAHAMDYAERVVEFSKRRQLRNVGMDAIRDAFCLTADVGESVNATEAKLAGIETGQYAANPVSISTAIETALQRANEAAERKRGIGVPIGFPNFDHLVGGLFAGELCILAARPGVGKTSLACQIAGYVARSGRGVYFASMEMDASELAMRMLCEASEVDSRIVRRGDTQQEELSRLVESGNILAQANLWIDQRPRITVRDMLRAARRMQSNGLGLVVVDYLQRIMPEDKKQDRYQQIAEICKGLKTMARELSVPVLCLCQLGRAAQQTGKPELHHLRESGDIEAEADVVMFLGTNVAWPPSKEPNESQAMLIIGKNRNGPTPKLRLKWDAVATRFSDPNFRQPLTEFEAYSGDTQPEDF